MTVQKPDAEKIYREALDHATQGDVAGSLPLFDEAIAKNPDDARYYSNKAIALLNLDRNEEVIDTALKATALDPAMPEPWINRGVALGNLERFEEAKKVLEHAVELAPHNPYARFNLATAYTKTGEPEKSEEQFSKAQDILYPKRGFGGIVNLIGGFVCGFAYYGVGDNNFLKGGIIVMFFLMCLKYLSELTTALKIKKEVRGLSDFESRMSSNRLFTFVLILATLGIAFGIGFATSRVLDMVLPSFFHPL